MVIMICVCRWLPLVGVKASLIVALSLWGVVALRVMVMLSAWWVVCLVLVECSPVAVRVPAEGTLTLRVMVRPATWRERMVILLGQPNFDGDVGGLVHGRPFWATIIISTWMF